MFDAFYVYRYMYIYELVEPWKFNNRHETLFCQKVDTDIRDHGYPRDRKCHYRPGPQLRSLTGPILCLNSCCKFPAPRNSSLRMCSLSPPLVNTNTAV